MSLELRTQLGRDYLDFVVDGRSLSKALSVPLVSWLANWPNPPSLGELLPEGVPELKQRIEDLGGEYCGQRLLFVCPNCGDAGCGAITAVIADEGDRIVWKDFANLDWDAIPTDWGPVFDKTGFDQIGPFFFAREQYVDVLRNRPLLPTL